MVVLLEGFSITTDELWSSVRVTIWFLVTSLTKALLPRLLSLDERPAQGRVLWLKNFFHLRMMNATVFLGTFNAAEMFCYPSPVLELYVQFLWHHGLVFALTCTGNCGTLYKQVCAFPNHVQSIELTTIGSSCRNISTMINGIRIYLSSISSLIACDLNTYVNKV